MEKRLLLAFVLSAVIFAVWSMLFAPPPPDGAPQAAPEIAPVTAPQAMPEEAPVEPGAEQAEPEAPLSAEVVEATVEETVVIGNELVSVELSNRGAAVTSHVLLRYLGDEGEPLDLIQTIDDSRRTLPLQLVGAEGPDRRLYEVERGDRSVLFRWADGRGAAVEKRMSLAEGSYALEFEMALRGTAGAELVSGGTGLRDLGVRERNNRLARWGDVALLMDGEFQNLRHKKVKEPRLFAPRSLAFGGLHDTYFLSVLRPASPVSELRIEPLSFVEQQADGEAEERRALQILVRPARGEFLGELLGAPKEYDLLRDIGGGVERTLDFGFFGPISVLFLKGLWWIYGLVGNYGVAIILLTVAIRVLLFPLMHTSTVSMRKMQKLQPKVKEIQAKYKKKKGDAQARAKMNQEMMALYKQEGVNPMSGCLPMLVQLPILWALYKLFLQSIELRHAPFMLWIQDLSAKDPIYVTPILMTATMWLQQRLAPQAGDPQQQRIMRMMPLIFGIMFLQFPSGLVLYWLTNNVLTIFQQELTFWLMGERKRQTEKGSKK
jgi:YidC/Oxa1 family membrane protein insertase